MAMPIQVTFRQLDKSPAVEADIRNRAEALERYFGRIVGCRVLVEPSTRRRHKGNLYHIRIDITVPGRKVVVDRDPPRHQAHEDIRVAVHDAFDAIRRRLEDHARSARGEVKSHEPPLHGRVGKLFKQDGYGFILAGNGEEIYMHRNAVSGDVFEALQEGDEVRYFVHDGYGEKGPQASSVVRIGKHHIVP